MYSEIENRIKEIIVSNMDKAIGVNDLDLSESPATYEISSICFVKIIVAIENEFGIEFADEDLDYTRFETMRGLITYVEDRLG